MSIRKQPSRLRRTILVAALAYALILVWQYAVISNAGILAQPGGLRYTSFSFVRPPLWIRRIYGPTVRVAWFPFCTLVAHSMDYPEGSGHWMVSFRHVVFRLGLVPPDESRANGIPLALLNSVAWLFMLWAALAIIQRLRHHIPRARA